MIPLSKDEGDSLFFIITYLPENQYHLLRNPIWYSGICGVFELDNLKRHFVATVTYILKHDTGKSIGFERHKTVPEKWLVLRVGFDPSSYILGGDNLFE